MNPSDDDLEPKRTSDSNLPAHQKHDLSADRKNEHISQKVYMMPESYNQLRIELNSFFPNLWLVVQGPMAWDAPKFCYLMDEALDCISQFDSDNVDGICKRYLDKLREKRGLGPLHQTSEYFANTQMEEVVRLARQVQEHGTLEDIRRIQDDSKKTD